MKRILFFTVMCVIFLFATFSYATFANDNKNKSEILLRFVENEKCGYMNENGDVIIKPQYDNVSDFSDGLAIVKKDGKTGVINERGHIVIPFRDIRFYSDFNDGFAMASDKNSSETRYYFLSKNGSKVGSFPYVAKFKNGFAAVAVGSKVPCALPSSEKVYSNIKFSYLDKNGKLASVRYDNALDFENGFAGVKHNGKWGLINEKYENVIDFIYDGITDFSEDVISVKKGEKWGLLNADFNLKTQFVYDELKTCKNGLIPAKKFGKWGVIDKNGKNVIGYKYENTEILSENLISICINDKFGIIDTKDNIFIPVEYKEIEKVDNNLIVLENKNSEYSIMDLNEKKVVELTTKHPIYIGSGWFIINGTYYNINNDKTLHYNKST